MLEADAAAHGISDHVLWMGLHRVTGEVLFGLPIRHFVTLGHCQFLLDATTGIVVSSGTYQNKG